MRTAIVYASKHGTTEKVAQNIQKMIGKDKAQLFNLKNNKHFDLTQFDQVVVGGSSHAGTIQKRIKNFVDQHRPELLEKKLGLFICCMHEQEAETEFNNAYPEILRSHAVSKKIMGGEFRFEKMNFIEKALVKKIAGVNDSVSNIDEGKIQELVGELEES